MTETNVTVKKAPVARSSTPDVWQSFRSDFDRLFERFSDAFGLPGWRSQSVPTFDTTFGFAAPAVDVVEDAKAYKITAELPGMDEKDVTVQVTDDLIVLKGEKRAEQEKKEKNYYLAERNYGTFERSFYLPNGTDANKVTASFAKGVLTVTLPKAAEAQAQTRKIEVKAA